MSSHIALTDDPVAIDKVALSVGYRKIQCFLLLPASLCC